MQSDQVIEKIRNKLSESDPASRTLMNIFQFHFTDSEGHHLKSVELNIYDGLCSAPDAHVTISDEHFLMIGSKQKTFGELIADNKVSVEGDKDAFNKMVEKMRLLSKKE